MSSPVRVVHELAGSELAASLLNHYFSELGVSPPGWWGLG
jgi:hypothetical protein